MRKYILLITFFISWVHAYSSNTVIYSTDSITGQIVDVMGSPLANASCTLLSVPDSVVISRVVSRVDGTFSLSAEIGVAYRLHISLLGYDDVEKNCGVGNLGIVTMRMNAQVLNEVIVTSQSLRTYANKDVLYLDEQTKKVGNNALDAISSLPQLSRSIDGSSLSTVDDKSVLVLINGIRMSARDLMLLQANDIKKITLYRDPPARYAHLGVGAVLDVTTKKKIDNYRAVYLDTKNGINTGYGTDMLAAYYMDSLNYVCANYYIDYRNMGKMLQDNIYKYEDLQNDYRGLSGNYKGAYQIGQVLYQRSQGKNMFYTNVKYIKHDFTNDFMQERINYADNIETINTRRLESDFSSASLDMYYTHTFSSRNSLSINMLNTFYNSSSDNSLNSNAAGYSFNNYFDNKTYSLIAEILYNDNLWKGNFNVGAYYRFKNLRQIYNANDKSRINTHQEYVYGDYSRGFGNFSFNLGIGLENNQYQITSNKSSNYFSVRPMLTLNLQLNKHSSIRLSSAVKTLVPDIGNLTNNKVSIDEHFYKQGNPELKPSRYIDNSLSFQFSSADGKWYIAPTLNYVYSPCVNMPVISIDKEDVIQSVAGVDDASRFKFMLSSSYRPVSWMSIQPYYYFRYYKYNTLLSRVRHCANNGGIRLFFTPKQWQFLLQVNSPTEMLDGDVSEKNEFSMIMSALYKMKRMSFGLEYQHSPKLGIIRSDVNNFSYSEATQWNCMKHLVKVTFTYYLYKGKTYNQGNKRINNSDNDSGLTKYNMAQ